jgi:hypothetical protein
MYVLYCNIACFIYHWKIYRNWSFVHTQQENLPGAQHYLDSYGDSTLAIQAVEAS